MDYRKPAVFGQNWSPRRYEVLPYFAVERQVFARPDIRRILEIGCGNGWNMSRFAQYGRPSMGLDAVPERVTLAATHGPALLADGLQLPFAAGSLDMVYIQHVLHHIGDVQRALSEVWRVLRPGGVLFLVETVEDNPIIRWGRRLYPSWLGDEINAPFTFNGLQETVQQAGFSIAAAGQYSVLFWLWEIMPDQLPPMERLTPAAVSVEKALQRAWPEQSAHCFVVVEKPSGGGRPPR
jgi:ubiquinone/menaquinone biosynthesis C-methylase UbiE